MYRSWISTILLVFLLLSVFTSCAKQEASQADPTPGTDQTQPVKQETPETELPYTFDSEQPTEIDLSIFTNDPSAYGSPVYRIEFDLEESEAGEVPGTLPIYRTDVYPQVYRELTDEQMQEAIDHFDRFLSCYSGAGDIKSVETDKGVVIKEIDGLKFEAFPESIKCNEVPMLCSTAENWERPSREDILSEIEQNEFVKTACRYLEITDPDIILETTVFETDDGGMLYNWDARIFQRSDDFSESAFNKSCRSLTLHGENITSREREETYYLSLQTISPVVAAESVPVISAEDALKEVLAGKYITTGMLFTNNDLADLTEDALVAVRLVFKNEGVEGIKATGLYVPFYEFIFNCMNQDGSNISQTKLVLPACNLYLKPAE